MNYYAMLQPMFIITKAAEFFNSGVQAKLIPGDNGRFTARQLQENLHPYADWLPRTSLVTIENTSNRGGGAYYQHKKC